MEFSKYLGVAEECSSSESGWTSYIVSPMHETKNHDDYYQHHYRHYGHNNDENDVDEVHGHGYGRHDYKKDCNEESDDSMVSDASSGPSRQGTFSRSSKRSGELRDPKHAVNRDQLGKNQRQGEKKSYNRRIRAEKEEQYKAHIGGKVRKPN